MEKKENNKQKRPLKLSSAGRLQLRKNLGPGKNLKSRSSEKGKTIQIIFRNKNNQRQTSSTTKSNIRGSSIHRPQGSSNLITSNQFPSKTKKHINQKNKKITDLKKTQSKKTTLKPNTDSEGKTGKLNINKVLEKEEQEYDKFPSLAKLKRAREKEKSKSIETKTIKISKEIIIPEIITVQELANRMSEKVSDVVKTLMNMGITATVTQTLEAETATIIATEFGHTVKIVTGGDILKEIEDHEDKEADLLPRPPVVTIMGHVDHGKTSILDSLRNSKIISAEAGGITQHIGAYQTNNNNKTITYIDTPGHEAFSNMRLRGAQTTDIIVLVVAANDSVKPQTIEAISHAKAAKVPIIVAINKIDLPSADPDKVRNDLLSHEIIVEKLRGDVLDVEISALKKLNLEKLEEAIHLQAELLKLNANPHRSSRGIIIESKLDKGRGAIATVLVQKGTLKIGDIFVSGSTWGKVKALIKDKGTSIKNVPPSFPAEVLGFNSSPIAGDDFIVVENESIARKIAEYRKEKALQKKNIVDPTNIEQMIKQISQGKIASLPVVIKTDVYGSAEAIENSILKLSTKEVAVQVLLKGVGGITESDVTLAVSGKGFIIGFNVRAMSKARDIAKQNGVDIRYYSIIYNLVDDIKKLMGGLLKPDINEKITGNVEVREIFSNSKIGIIAGCYVKEGFIKGTSKIRILRDNIVIHNGTIGSLKRFKDEAKEVQKGYECGVMIDDFKDIKVNDIIETYEFFEQARKL